MEEIKNIVYALSFNVLFLCERDNKYIPLTFELGSFLSAVSQFPCVS